MFLVITAYTPIVISLSDSESRRSGSVPRPGLRQATSDSIQDPNDTWSRIQGERRRLVAEKCTSESGYTFQRSFQDTDMPDSLLVDPRHRIIYCAIPKVACSSWKTLLVKLSGRATGKKPYAVHDKRFLKSKGIFAWDLLSEKARRYALEKYTKFIVVRHPLERLLSAYRDKLVVYNRWTRSFQERYGRNIAFRYHGNRARTTHRKSTYNVTFPEFLRFLADSSIPLSERTNRHWDTYQNLCRPCTVNYDHVIKFETLADDVDEMLRRYFSVANGTQVFPRRNSKPVPSRSLQNSQYSGVPVDTLEKIRAMFHADFEMFGYRKEINLLPS